MLDLLEKNREAIAALCAKYGVVRLEIFGSAVRDDFDSETSDVDLLVELGPMGPYERVDAYFNLLNELVALLARKVDLVMVGAIKNPYIRRRIEETKQLLYAA